MRKIKTKEQKNNKKEAVVEEEINVKKVLTVSIILLVIFFAFYGLTVLVLNIKKDNNNPKYNSLVSSSKDILVSDMLKQKEDLYYVLAINDNYNSVYELYTKKLDNFYYIDLSNALNKNIIGKEEKIDDDPRNIKIKDTTLFVIENKKIKEYYVGYDKVVNKMKTIAF